MCTIQIRATRRTLIKPTKGSLFIKRNLNTKGNSKSENTARTAEKKKLLKENYGTDINSMSLFSHS